MATSLTEAASRSARIASTTSTLPEARTEALLAAAVDAVLHLHAVVMGIVVATALLDTAMLMAITRLQVVRAVPLRLEGRLSHALQRLRLRSSCKM